MSERRVEASAHQAEFSRRLLVRQRRDVRLRESLLGQLEAREEDRGVHVPVPGRPGDRQQGTVQPLFKASFTRTVRQRHRFCERYL